MIRMNAREVAAIGLKLRGYTYRDIAEVLGVTRQRAQQIVKPKSPIVRQVRPKEGKARGIYRNSNGHRHNRGR